MSAVRVFSTCGSPDAVLLNISRRRCRFRAADCDSVGQYSKAAGINLSAWNARLSADFPAFKAAAGRCGRQQIRPETERRETLRDAAFRLRKAATDATMRKSWAQSLPLSADAWISDDETSDSVLTSARSLQCDEHGCLRCWCWGLRPSPVAAQMRIPSRLPRLRPERHRPWHPGQCPARAVGTPARVQRPAWPAVEWAAWPVVQWVAWPVERWAAWPVGPVVEWPVGRWVQAPVLVRALRVQVRLVRVALLQAARAVWVALLQAARAV